jgi:DNA-binding beta-propeller fold protein YncE
MSGCGQPHRRPEPDNLFWPLPPEKPRIKYIESIYSEDDIGRVYSIREMLFGKSYNDTMSRPYGIFAHRGHIYVADVVSGRVILYDRNNKVMQVFGQEGAIRTPADAVSDGSGTLYVADSGQNKVAVYDAQGEYQTAFPLGPARPVSLALNEALGRLYVVDRTGHQVIVLSLNGDPLFHFGSRGIDKGQFNAPLGIALSNSGNVYVLDAGNFRVQVFDADGKFIRSFGSVGDRSGFFANPKGIAVDSENHIYVSDAAFNNFQIFDEEGHFLLNVGNLGFAPGELYLPADMSIDENDRIYIADQLNSRIEIFQYLKSP